MIFETFSSYICSVKLIFVSVMSRLIDCRVHPDLADLTPQATYLRDLVSEESFEESSQFVTQQHLHQHQQHQQHHPQQQLHHLAFVT
eukprot:TRINITY_DN5827_c0_g4_i1.p1 TRINITY_DN5827_c0_g4~~TRINITY_DN5827_c0_g4_i1.p1  ORF type:complete len:102 (-),score=33.27 TRINITY_DN5827_c0_g4_i1:35-295(-)